MTLYASLEKKRTLWPVPGVLPGFKIDRMEANLDSVMGVSGGWAASVDGLLKSSYGRAVGSVERCNDSEPANNVNPGRPAKSRKTHLMSFQVSRWHAGNQAWTQ